MSHFGKVEADVHINASAEKFHEIFSSKTHHIANISPGKIKSVDLHKGDWGKVGSIIVWNYVHEGKACVAKDVVEAIDPTKNSITFKVIEGDLLEHYKGFKATIQVNPKGKGSVAHWTFEYEKLHGQVPDPHSLMQLAFEISKEIDSHLTQGQGNEEQLFGKLEVDVHINAYAKKFHEIFSSKPHHIPNISPGKIQGATVEGSWGKEGSVIVWHFLHDGNNCMAKEVIEAIDPEKNLITLGVVEGEPLKYYKSLKLTLQASPKDKGSVVHVTVEYEKLNGYILEPHRLIQLAVEGTKDIDAHLTQ